MAYEDIQDFPISMIRPTLDDIPQYELPAGYAFRWYAPGDERHWVSIHLEADRLNKITPELFTEQFGTDAQRLHERQCYLVAPSGETIGTASAWFKTYLELEYGLIHWVAILPAWQGRGLAKPLLTTVCNRLRELGYVRSYLDTSTSRIPALQLYLNFGFTPNIHSEVDEERWSAIRKYLRF